LKRWLTRLLLIAIAGLLLFVFGYVPYFLAGAFTVRTFQMKDAENDGVTPATFSLPFEDVSFESRDKVPLSGWWVPAEGAKGTVILVHGLNRSRIEMVRKVPFVHSQGWNALLFDLRRHGKSGGTVRSLGYHEQEDVLGAFDLAQKRAPGPVVVWGISFGAAASVFAAAAEPRITGVVCDSSYRSLRDTARHHLALFRRFAWWLRLVPTWPTADEAVFWMGRRGGFDPDDVDVVKAAAKLAGRPALFVAGSDDERMPSDIALDLQRAAGPKASVLVVPGQPMERVGRDGQKYTSGHGHAYRDGQKAYEAAVAGLLEQSLSQ
jgi:pimeloyl-ACP methyl ester carboxylesterase